MLSLARLAGVDQRYYLDHAERPADHAESVSTGAEDYYLSGPAARGAGSAARSLRLSGEVTEAGAPRDLSKQDPSTGKDLEGSVEYARVPGSLHGHLLDGNAETSP